MAPVAYGTIFREDVGQTIEQLTIKPAHYFIFKSYYMSDRNKTNTGSRGNDGSETRNKGESMQNPQKGAQGVSNKRNGKHRKDESEGAEKNTTKKGGNSI